MSTQLIDYQELKQDDLSKVRKIISPKAYKHSMFLTFGVFFIDLAFYLIIMFGIFTVKSILVKIILGLLAGIVVSGMFVWAHDAAHGSLFKNKLLSEILGTIFMLPSLNIYRLWSYGHNRVHHGFTSYSNLDWIWRPLTIQEYRNMSKFKKKCYRVERSLYGCGLHYIYKVWWPKMIMFMPSDINSSKKNIIRISKAITLLFVLTIGIIYYHSGGVISIISALILPFIVFNYVISLIVYLHHTHPNLPFFADRNEWNISIGALYCTTVINTNWLINKLTHNILIHTPHHVDIRIPFYRLKYAFLDIKKYYSKYLHEYDLDFTTLKYIFKVCKLYDYKNHVWYSFSAAESLKLDLCDKKY